jgi:hypothetical protein
MFGGDEMVRFAADRPLDDVFDAVEDSLASLGAVRVTRHGEIDVTPRRAFENALAQTRIEGDIKRRKNGDYEVYLSYACALTAAGWS